MATGVLIFALVMGLITGLYVGFLAFYGMMVVWRLKYHEECKRRENLFELYDALAEEFHALVFAEEEKQ